MLKLCILNNHFLSDALSKDLSGFVYRSLWSQTSDLGGDHIITSRYLLALNLKRRLLNNIAKS
jgi:hypothetical protein